MYCKGDESPIRLYLRRIGTEQDILLFCGEAQIPPDDNASEFIHNKI